MKAVRLWSMTIGGAALAHADMVITTNIAAQHLVFFVSIAATIVLPTHMVRNGSGVDRRKR